MSRKLAVFVEGYTEQEFVIRLLAELAGKRGVEFQIHSQHRGRLSFVEIRKTPIGTTSAELIHVLVANCQNDAQVKSQIKDQYNSLLSAGYSLVVGLRDVYPLTHGDIPGLERLLLTGLPAGALPIRIHLAVLEVEAWFLEELSHYHRIDTNIALDSLGANGFDFNNSRADNLPHPAETLDNIYKTVGKRYAKRTNQIQRTVNALSYEELYVSTRHKAASLDGFISTLEVGLFSN